MATAENRHSTTLLSTSDLSVSCAPLLLDAHGVARLLNMSTSGLYRLLTKKRVPAAIRLGRRALWPASLIRKWVEAGCPPPARWRV